MKIRQIVNESKDPIEIFNQYFDTTGDIEWTTNGLTVRGDVELKEGKRIEKIPVQFDKIVGTFDLSTTNRLTTLDNFPRHITEIVYLGVQPELTSLATQYPVSCGDSFDVSGCRITDLTGCQITTRHFLALRNCVNLKSLDGLTGRIGGVDLYSCPQFEADITKYNNITFIHLNITDNDIKMPLVRALAFATNPKGTFRPIITLVAPNASKIGKIIQKYRGKGPENILDIMRDLRDAGFEDAAVL